MTAPPADAEKDALSDAILDELRRLYEAAPRGTIETENWHKATPLFYAARQRVPALIERLEAAEAKVSRYFHEGRMALQERDRLQVELDARSAPVPGQRVSDEELDQYLQRVGEGSWIGYVINDLRDLRRATPAIESAARAEMRNEAVAVLQELENRAEHDSLVAEATDYDPKPYEIQAKLFCKAKEAVRVLIPEPAPAGPSGDGLLPDVDENGRCRLCGFPPSGCASEECPATPDAPAQGESDAATRLAERILGDHCACYAEAFPADTCAKEVETLSALLRKETVPIGVYESAVGGRQAFRQALKEARDALARAGIARGAEPVVLEAGQEIWILKKDETGHIHGIRQLDAAPAPAVLHVSDEAIEAASLAFSVEYVKSASRLGLPPALKAALTAALPHIAPPPRSSTGKD